MKQFTLSFMVATLALFTPTDSAVAQWVQVGPPGLTVYSLAASGSDVFAGTYLFGLYRSQDDGQTWTRTSLQSETITSIITIGPSVFAGTYGSGLYRSTDNGETWTQTGLSNPTVRALAVSGSNIFAGTSGGVYHSIDNGQTWTQTSLSLRPIFSIAVRGSYVAAGTDSGVYVSADNGQSWSQSALKNTWIQSIAVTSTTILAGTWEEDLYLSSDNGGTWSTVALYDIPALMVSGSEVFAGVNGVYLSRDNGQTWTRVSQGLGYYSVLSLAISADYVYAGLVMGNSIWRRPIEELVTSVHLSNEAPGEFRLEQNYPNPFNPSTTISFQLPTQSHVALTVFDVLGREIATLVNETKESGSYEVTWDAAGVASGVYYYLLKSGGHVATKKLVLLH
jgi:photosystem II stability/assembly factor-like uncharacterized protein